MDVLGTASAVLGIFQVGFSLAKAIRDTVKDYKDAADDLTSLAQDIESTLYMVSQLEKLILDNKKTGTFNAGGLAELNKCQRTTEQIVEALLGLLTKTGISHEPGTKIRPEDLVISRSHRRNWLSRKSQVKGKQEELTKVRLEVTTIILLRNVLQASSSDEKAMQQTLLLAFERDRRQKLRARRKQQKRGAEPRQPSPERGRATRDSQTQIASVPSPSRSNTDGTRNIEAFAQCAEVHEPGATRDDVLKSTLIGSSRKTTDDLTNDITAAEKKAVGDPAIKKTATEEPALGEKTNGRMLAKSAPEEKATRNTDLAVSDTTTNENTVDDNTARDDAAYNDLTHLLPVLPGDIPGTGQADDSSPVSYRLRNQDQLHLSRESAIEDFKLQIKNDAIKLSSTYEAMMERARPYLKGHDSELALRRFLESEYAQTWSSMHGDWLPVTRTELAASPSLHKAGTTSSKLRRLRFFGSESKQSISPNLVPGLDVTRRAHLLVVEQTNGKPLITRMAPLKRPKRPDVRRTGLIWSGLKDDTRKATWRSLWSSFALPHGDQWSLYDARSVQPEPSLLTRMLVRSVGDLEYSDKRTNGCITVFVASRNQEGSDPVRQAEADVPDYQEPPGFYHHGLNAIPLYEDTNVAQPIQPKRHAEEVFPSGHVPTADRLEPRTSPQISIPAMTRTRTRVYAPGRAKGYYDRPDLWERLSPQEHYHRRPRSPRRPTDFPETFHDSDRDRRGKRVEYNRTRMNGEVVEYPTEHLDDERYRRSSDSMHWLRDTAFPPRSNVESEHASRSTHIGPPADVSSVLPKMRFRQTSPSDPSARDPDNYAVGYDLPPSFFNVPRALQNEPRRPADRSGRRVTFDDSRRGSMSMHTGSRLSSPRRATPGLSRLPSLRHESNMDSFPPTLPSEPSFRDHSNGTAVYDLPSSLSNMPRASDNERRPVDHFRRRVSFDDSRRRLSLSVDTGVRPSPIKASPGPSRLPSLRHKRTDSAPENNIPGDTFPGPRNDQEYSERQSARETARRQRARDDAILRRQQDAEAAENISLDREVIRVQYRQTFDPLHELPETLRPQHRGHDSELSLRGRPSSPTPPTLPRPMPTSTRFASSSPLSAHAIDRHRDYGHTSTHQHHTSYIIPPASTSQQSSPRPGSCERGRSVSPQRAESQSRELSDDSVDDDELYDQLLQRFTGHGLRERATTNEDAGDHVKEDGERQMNLESGDDADSDDKEAAAEPHEVIVEADDDDEVLNNGGESNTSVPSALRRATAARRRLS